MIELKTEHDYVIGDTADWLSDMSEPHEDAQASFDAFREREDAEYYAGNDILPWLETLHDSGAWQDEETGEWQTYGRADSIRPTGLYGEDKPFTAVSVNEDNWLSDDVMVTLAHTAEFGDLLIWQHGYYTGAAVNVCSFNGDDDADAYSWSGGSAGHADCDSEWILQNACEIWRNGGGDVHKLWDLAHDDAGAMLCPDHNVPLEFVGY